MNKYLFIAGLFFSLLGCSSASTRRNPASSDSGSLVTRDGAPVIIPGLTKAFNIPSCSSLGAAAVTTECVQPNEDALFDQITQLSFAFQSAQNPPSEKVSQRDFHPKQHACLAAVWTPLPGLSSDLAVGAFGLSKSVSAIVRFSNGSPKSPAGNGQAPPDAGPDARGLGIKLVGVPGQTILNIEDPQNGAMNQDFVLINYPAFFLRNPKSYPDFFRLITVGKPFFGIMDRGELQVLKETQRSVPDVVAERFFSQTPYVLGDHYAKYSVRSCQTENPAPMSATEARDPNFLRARIKARLDANNICLIFSVQIKGDNMPVEDAATTWSEGDAKFTDVAKLMIPKGQDINDPARDAYCENISFNPWNSLAENRPAGGINRARLAVYGGVSRKRRTENKVVIREPKSDDAFFSVLGH